MTIHWGSFWLGVVAITVAEFLFLSIRIALAERRVKKLVDDERGKG